jgi:transposase
MSRVNKDQHKPEPQSSSQGSRKVYTQEFRDEAVRLTVSSGKPVAQIARDLGISVGALHDWRRQAHYDNRLPVPEHETPEQQLKRLHKENELLKQERDILKKAMAYFAQPPQK